MAGPLMRQLNKWAVARVRRSGGTFFGMDVLVVNTVGTKSGAARSTPVGWFRGDDGTWLIVASANGGPRNPAWFHNIVGNPDQVTIDVDHRRIPVIPEQLHGAERARAWEIVTTKSPQFARYETKTEREIPVIRLTPR
jgi:deazaflavin-dependent oxidoreductase (nitroreductase family)